MRALKNIFHLSVKELYSLYRDPVLLVLIVWSFSLAIYTAGTGHTQDLKNAPIAVVDEDRSPLSIRIASAFYPPYFKHPELIGLEQVDPGMDAGIYTFVLDIPAGFERDLLAGRPTAAQLSIDATMMSQAFTGAGYIQRIFDDEVMKFVAGGATPPVHLVTHYRFNPTLTGTWFGGVLELINNITMLAVILTGAALIREREHGTLEHLLVMPLTPAQIMFSKVLAMGVVVLTAAALSLWLVIEQLLQMPIAGSTGLFLLAAALYLFSATSLGILIGTLSRTMPQLGLLMILVILPLQMLSGGETPFEAMPQALQLVMLAAPTTHFVAVAQAVLFRGAGIVAVWHNLLALIAIGAAFFVITLAIFRDRVAAVR